MPLEFVLFKTINMIASAPDASHESTLSSSQISTKISMNSVYFYIKHTKYSIGCYTSSSNLIIITSSESASNVCRLGVRLRTID